MLYIYVGVCVCVCVYIFSVCVYVRAQLCLTLLTPWTVAHQASQSMGFPRQEDWSGFAVPPPGDLLGPGIKPMSPESPALADGFFITESPEKSILCV